MKKVCKSGKNFLFPSFSLRLCLLAWFHILGSSRCFRWKWWKSNKTVLLQIRVGLRRWPIWQQHDSLSPIFYCRCDRALLATHHRAVYWVVSDLRRVVHTVLLNEHLFEQRKFLNRKSFFSWKPAVICRFVSEYFLLNNYTLLLQELRTSFWPVPGVAVEYGMILC